MWSALRAELLKLRKRPALWVLLAVLVGVQVLFGYVFVYVFLGLETEAPDVRVYQLLDRLMPQEFVTSALGDLAGMGAALAIILGVLVVGSEYRWNTLKTIATQGPPRPALAAGKLGSLAAAMFVFTVAYLLTALVCSSIVASLEGEPVVLPSAGIIAGGLGAGWLVLSAWATFGALLAVALRGTGLAIGLGLLYALVLEELLLAALFPWSETIDRVLHAVLPGSNANALVQHLGVPPGPPASPLSALTVATVMLGYLVLFSLGAGLIFHRRDIA